MPKLLITIHSPAVYGAGRMAAIFAVESKRLGFEVEVAYCKELPKSEPSITKELAMEGMPVHYVPNMAAELFPFGTQPLTKLIQQRGIDLVVSSQMRDVAPAMIAARRNSKSALAVCMNLPNYRGNVLVQYVKRWLYRRAVASHADHVVVVAPAIRDEFVRNYNVSIENITVVPCAMDLKSIPAMDPQAVDQLRNEMEITADHFVAVNLARICPQKGQDLLVEAIGKLKSDGELPSNFRMLFVGGCETHEMEVLLNQHIERVSELSLADQIRFVGFRKDFRNFLYLADTFVLPSRWEGLPLVVLESFAAKVPVLMTEYGEPLEHFQNELDGLYVPSENVTALARGLKRMMSMTADQRNEMGRRGRKYLGEHLTMERSLELFGNVLKRLTNAP